MRVLVDSSSLYSALLHDGTVAEVVGETLATHPSSSRTTCSRSSGGTWGALGSRDDVDAYPGPFVEAVDVFGAREYRSHLSRVPEDVSRKDAPGVAAALDSEVDVLLTSDHELLGLDPPGAEVAAPATWRGEG